MNAGGLPVVLPLTSDEVVVRQICLEVDGLLFTGGQDVSPGLYGEETNALCGPLCGARDEMEALLFAEAVINMGKPAFGICRGLQFFNAALGGTLYQDLPSQFSGAEPIRHKQEQPMGEPSHSVTLEAGSPLGKFIGSVSIEVNSSHHQAIHKLSPELAPMAIAADGLVEAAYMPKKRFLWGVQWHPECSLQDESSQKLFAAFVSAC